MNIKEAASSSDSSDSSNTRNKSGSGGSSGSNYPKTDERVPLLAIWENEDGELVSQMNPQNQFIVYEKKKAGAQWSRKLEPAEMERYWMSQSDLMLTVQLMERHFGVEGKKMLLEQPRKGLDLARRAAKKHNPDAPTVSTRKCAVCEDEINMKFGSFEEVGNRIVCDSHNITEIKQAGLLD